MQPRLRDACVAECLGTFLLLVFGLGCVAALKVAGISYGLWDICMIWGAGVALAVYLSAGVSGGHINPAVTVALAVFGRFPAARVLPYVAAQMVGALLAAALIYALYSSLFEAKTLDTLGVFVTAPHPGIALWQACLAELVGTAILVALILALVDDRNGAPRGALAPLLIGVTVAAIGAVIGPLSSFALNPARDLGPRLFAFAAGWGNDALTGGREVPYLLVPLIAPLLGGVVGAGVYLRLIAAALVRGEAESREAG